MICAAAAAAAARCCYRCRRHSRKLCERAINWHFIRAFTWNGNATHITHKKRAPPDPTHWTKSKMLHSAQVSQKKKKNWKNYNGQLKKIKTIRTNLFSQKKNKIFNWIPNNITQQKQMEKRKTNAKTSHIENTNINTRQIKLNVIFSEPTHTFHKIINFML